MSSALLSMKVLHLFSNARWTGPAEPALNLCVALKRRGIDVDMAFPLEAPGSQHTMLETARDRGIEPVPGFCLSKHSHPIKNLLDRRTLKRLLRERHYDIIHCHLDNDHRIATGVAGRFGIPVVRSSYEGMGLQKPSKHRKLLAKTAYIVQPSRMAMEHDAEAYGFPHEYMMVVPGAIDMERFDPARDVPDGRRWLNIPQDAFVVGIVARMQRHRHYEDFFRAMRRLVDAHPNTHAIVVGRGTRQEEVGKTPVRELGLDEHVHFSGYVAGENYVGMLKAFDVKVFLVPGSDGTCRAVREAMAMGKPAIVANRGMLSEIVTDGENGYVVEGTADSLLEALNRIASDRVLARELGKAAHAMASTRYSLDAQAHDVAWVYERLKSEV